MKEEKGNTKPCQRSWKSRSPWTWEGEATNKQTLVCYVSRSRESQRGKYGLAGEGARELFPRTAGPGTHKYFDPEHPLAGDSKGSSLALGLC